MRNKVNGIVALLFLMLVSHSHAFGQYSNRLIAKRNYLSLEVAFRNISWDFASPWTSYRDAKRSISTPYLATNLRIHARKRLSNGMVGSFNLLLNRGGLVFQSDYNINYKLQYYTYTTIAPGVEILFFPNGQNKIPAPFGLYVLGGLSYWFQRVNVSEGEFGLTEPVGTYLGTVKFSHLRLGFGRGFSIGGLFLAKVGFELGSIKLIESEYPFRRFEHSHFASRGKFQFQSRANGAANFNFSLELSGLFF